MQVGILGSGGAAFGAAALLHSMGHGVMLWSPSGRGTAELAAGSALTARGALEASFKSGVASSCAQAVAEADVVMLAVPGYGHKAIFDAAAPHIRAGQPFIISSHVSFGAHYLAGLLAERNVEAPITAWSTTLTTGKKATPTEVQVNSVRAQVDMATLNDGGDGRQKSLRMCEQLFGERFMLKEGLMAIALSNLNPQNHLAISLMNLTRMELGENWNQGAHITPAVGRLIEALDLERLEVAKRFGVSVRTVQEHFSRSYPVEPSGVHEMNREMVRKGIGGFGPKTAQSRYVLEDVPFGLVVTATLARIAGVPAPLHEAGIVTLSAAYGRDFGLENDLLHALNIDGMSMEQLRQFAETGKR